MESTQREFIQTDKYQQLGKSGQFLGFVCGKPVYKELSILDGAKQDWWNKMTKVGCHVV